MTPRTAETMRRTSVGALLVFWTACLTVQWSWALDASWASTLGAVVAVLSGLCLAGRGAFGVVRGVRGVLAGVGLTSAGASTIVAALCGLCSWGAVRAAGLLADQLVAAVVWSRVTWQAAAMAIQCVGMAPMALGLAVVLGPTVAGRDDEAAGGAGLVLWCRAGALGLAGFAVAWWLGVSFGAISAVTALLLLLAAGVLRTIPLADPVERAADEPGPGRMTRRGRRACCVVAGVVLSGGASLVGDVAGLGPAWCAVMLAAVLGLAGQVASKPRVAGAFSLGSDPRPVAGAMAVGVLVVLVASLAGLAVVPRGAAWRREEIGQLLAAAMAHRTEGKRWWVVASSSADAPSPMPSGVVAMRAAFEPAGLGDVTADDQLAGEFGADFLAALRAGRGRYDGIVLAPGRADGPAAWRCYAERTLRLCVGRLHERGVVLLRTQAGRDRGGDVLAVAGSFRRAVGSGWLAVAWGQGDMDILLAGPAGVVPRPAPRRGVVVVDLTTLAERWPQIESMKMTHPRGVLAPSPSTIEFGQWLRGQ